MRVALCFWGLCRSTDLVVQSFEENVLQPLAEAGYEIDIYLHTYKWYKTYTNLRSNEIGLLLKNTNYKLLNPRRAIVENQEQADNEIDFHTYRSNGDPWVDDCKSEKEAWITHSNHLRALWSLKKVTGLWQSSARSYDAIIYLRPDVRFKTKFDVAWIEAVRRGTVFIPDFHVYFGSNDRFAIGSPSDMGIYGNRFDGAFEYSRKKPLHAEGFLTDYMYSKGIKFECVPFRFQRVRANGVTCEADLNVL